jgi:hypothetical protein
MTAFLTIYFNVMVLYRDYEIHEDCTGIAPKWGQFHFYMVDDEEYQGSGETIEDCKAQIDELILDKE